MQLDLYHQRLEALLSRVPTGERSGLLSAFTVSKVAKGGYLSNQGMPDESEYLLVEGRARSLVTDADGKEACLNLYLGPTVISPNIARTSDGNSLVDIEMLDDGIVATIEANRLMVLMVKFEGIREWANAIMREELAQKVGREWCLSALLAPQRLEWFRANHPEFEEHFAHSHIASYLGMTPVTLSRARNR